MISHIFLKICRWRFSLLRFSIWSIFKWNTKLNNIEFSDFTNYRIFCAIQFGFYLLTKAVIVAHVILNYMFSTIKNGNQDIFDVTRGNINNYDETLIYICHANYVGINVLML